MAELRKDWRDEALCASLTPEQSDDLFFIGPGKSSKRARLFCSTCPVRQNCNDFAVMYNESGIWAGNTDEDRRHLDPFISSVLRAQAEAEGLLESRNLNDFIPQVRNQNQEEQNHPDLLEDLQVPLADSLLGELTYVVEQLKALDPLYEYSNDLRRFAR